MLARGLTTTKFSKQKPNITKQKMDQLKKECDAYNKRMKQSHRHSDVMTIDQYISFVYGKGKTTTSRSTYKPSEPYRRSSHSHIKSHGDSVGVCVKPEAKVYTGNLIKGIATMHKSNAVPIIDEQHAKDVAQMRRN